MGAAAVFPLPMRGAGAALAKPAGSASEVAKADAPTKRKRLRRAMAMIVPDALLGCVGLSVVDPPLGGARTAPPGTWSSAMH
jgi:hypothetical protein